VLLESCASFSVTAAATGLLFDALTLSHASAVPALLAEPPASATVSAAEATEVTLNVPSPLSTNS